MMIAHTTEIAYFGEHTQVTLSCSKCGWKQTDFIPASGARPGAWSLPILTSEDLLVRVIRGSSCTVRIPELDLEVKPGSHSTGYVSNVEGVLDRFQTVVEMVQRELDPEELDSIRQCASMLASIESIRAGKAHQQLTLVLLDPRGHSQILHPDAISRDLDADELAELQLGPDPAIFAK